MAAKEAEEAEAAAMAQALAVVALNDILEESNIPLTENDKDYLMSWYNDDYSDTKTLSLVSRFSLTNETAYKTLAQRLKEWKDTKIAAYQAGGKQKSKRIRKKTRSRLTHRKQLKQKQTQRKKSKQTQRKKLKQTRRK